MCVSRSVCGGRGYRQALSCGVGVGGLAIVISHQCCGCVWSVGVWVCGWVIMFVVMAMFVVDVGVVVVVCVSFSDRIRVCGCVCRVCSVCSV